MTDFDLPREAVEAAIIAHHNFVLGEDVPLTKREIGIVFQSWHAALTAALPYIATLPSVEALADALAAEGIGPEPGELDLTPTAERLLALLPGRTEAEVKAEALREAASGLVALAERLADDEMFSTTATGAEAYLDGVDRAAEEVATQAERITRGEGS